MMRKHLLIIVFLFFGIGSQSQVLITLLFGDKLNSDGLEFGLEGGFNWANISGLESHKYARKWNLGFYFDIRLKNHWFLYTGVLVKSNMGIDNLTTNDLDTLGATRYMGNDGQFLDGEYSQKLNYFMVPVLAKYKFNSHVYIEAGPQFGLMYKAWVEFEADLEDKDALFKEYNKDQVNRIDAGIMAGLGYTLYKGTGWTIGAKYYYGFVNTFKGMPGTKNSSFFIKLDIPIGAGEDAQEKAAEKSAKRKAKKEAKKEVN